MTIKHIFSIIFLSVSVMLHPIFAQYETQINLPDGVVARIGKGKITAMRFIADGTLLAVGTDIGVWIYDVKTKNVKHLLTPHPKGADNFVISPDNTILASSGCKSGVVILWDLNTGEKIHTLDGEVNIVGSALAFSKDGKTLVGLYTNQTADYILKRWDVATTKVMSRETSNGIGAPLVCYPDENIFGGISREGKIKLVFPNAPNPGVKIDRKLNSLLSKFRRPGDIKSRLAQHSIMTLTFSADGKTIATGGKGGIVRLWDTETLTERASLKVQTGWITAIVFTQDNSILASGDAGKNIHLWDARTGEQLASLKGHTHTITALSFTPDGKTLASGSLDGTIRFWDINTATELSVFTTDHIMETREIAFSKDNATCVTSTFNGKVQTWNVKTGRKLNSFDAAPMAFTQAMTISPDASLFSVYGTQNAMIITSRNGNRLGGHLMQNTDIIRLWDLSTGTELTPIKKRLGARTLRFSPDNRLLVTTSRFDKSLVLETATATELFPFKTRESIVAFSFDNKILATDGNYGETHLLDVKTGNILSKITTGEVETLAFSPDNTILAIGTSKEIHLWNLNSENKPNIVLTKHIIHLEKGAKEINVLSFSPDGKTLLGNFEGHRIIKGPVWSSEYIYGFQLWDVEKAEKLTTYTGHSHEVKSLQFSHDGKILASSSKDGTVLLWDWDKIYSKSIENEK